MARYRYFLHSYDHNSPEAAETFGSRRALCSYMRSLPYSPSELADKYFLHVCSSKFSAIYNFKVRDSVHLSAVLSRKTVYGV